MTYIQNAYTALCTFLLRKEADEAMDQACVVAPPLPWIREGPMTRELLVDQSPNGKPMFYLIDPWHTIHLGVGKTWVACGVMMLQALLPDSSMDDRVAFMGAEYKAFCKRNKLDAVIRKIDVHTFGGSTDPNGAWHKAAVTSSFMMFLQEYCEQNSEMLQGDERLKVFVS